MTASPLMGALRLNIVVVGNGPPEPTCALPAMIASFTAGPARNEVKLISSPRFDANPMSPATLMTLWPSQSGW
jgi:hypothetical protein